MFLISLFFLNKLYFLCCIYHLSKKGPRALLSGILGSCVFTPDVQHEDGSNEQQRHDQNGNWTNFDAG